MPGPSFDSIATASLIENVGGAIYRKLGIDSFDRSDAKKGPLPRRPAKSGYWALTYTKSYARISVGGPKGSDSLMQCGDTPPSLRPSWRYSGRATYYSFSTRLIPFRQAHTDSFPMKLNES